MNIMIREVPTEKYKLTEHFSPNSFPPVSPRARARHASAAPTVNFITHNQLS